MSVRHLGPDQLLDLLDNLLDDAGEASARAHLASCRDCAEVYRSQRDVRAMLRGSGAPTPDPSLTAGLLSLPALSLSPGSRLGSGALLPTPESLGGEPQGVLPPSVGTPAQPADVEDLPSPFGVQERRPDTARWLFSAALLGGVSLAALGGANTASAGTVLPAAKTVMQGVSGQSWSALLSTRDNDR